MRSQLSRVRLLTSGLLAACLLWTAGVAWAAPKAVASPAPVASAPMSLDNATCLSCHDGTKGKLEVPDAAAKPRTVRTVVPAAFAKGVHAKMQCVACHTDIKDDASVASAHQSGTGQPLKKVDCAGCHQDLWSNLQKEGKTADKPRLGVVVQNIDLYKQSFHARPNADDKTKPNASCDNCHDTHSFNVPPANAPDRGAWRLTISATCGDNCHTDQLEAYTDSVHGQETIQKHNPKSAVCTDCHTSHAISNTSGDPFKVAISAQCGNCHEANYASYKATYHGQISTLGYAYTAKCYNCHGSHDILKVDNPKSKVHANNRMKTCETCHSGKKDLAKAPAGFATFQPHGHHGDFKRYPEIWIAFQIMVQLLVGTFAFFWLHTLFWFYREFKERRSLKGQPRVRIDQSLSEVPASLRNKHIQRFSPIWRLAHITFALSLMILTLTGMPLFYPDAPWASAIMSALGGPHIAGTIHRVNAVIFAAVFFWHLFYLLWGIVSDWKNFKFFGPNSMIPNLKDARDMLGMFKWFFGKGPRPQFDRWTYWEKFDYWAPFWGVTIIGVSGLIMWLPNVFGAFLPGWVFNVAAIFHGEEAFLAVVFLFTVHFFNNHFRPDKFPVEVVMFTGTFSLEEFKHEHPLEYQRLVDSGELQGRLVDAPSPLKLAASKVLGFTLIVIGLTLLTLVGVGFFTSF